MPSILLRPLQLGDLLLPNRIIMAPLTRQRSGAERIPNLLMAEYYSQRASAGLIISEATLIDPLAAGYADTPGIWNQAQVEGWKTVTDEIHKKGGRIFLQLWHVGRISDPFFLNGNTPVAPSSVQPAGHVSLLKPQRPYPIPRALELDEIKNLVHKFVSGAHNAKSAGFDGVEIHAANGYLVDQFLQTKTNRRTDIYGGSLENRARFLLEIVDGILPIWGPGKVGVHLAPACDAHDMGDENPSETFGFVAHELGKRKLAFIFTREGYREGYLTKLIKSEFKGVVIGNQGLTPSIAEELINSNQIDAAAWGKYFISNPDLVDRIQNKIAFTDYNPDTFYTGGAVGYTTYKRAQ